MEIEDQVENWHFPLMAHKAGIRTFDLSSGINYISMKDQVVRATTLVNCLKRCGLFNTTKPEFDLIVVGAGVAGVSAASHAAQLGLRVLVLEREGQRFPLQRACKSRHVSFSMYDWPEAHASVGSFPSLGELPVASEGIGKVLCSVHEKIPVVAKDLVEKWESDAEKLEFAAPGDVTWIFEAEVCPPGPDAHFDLGNERDRLAPVSVTYMRKGAKEPTTASILIFATGIGKEQTVPGKNGMDRYGPPDFWTDMEDPPWGQHVSDDLSEKEIVIAGAGDGAIQDFLKIVYRDQADKLLDLADACKLSSEQLAGILSAERHVTRQLMWNTPRKEAFGALQKVIDDVVVQVLNQNPNPVQACLSIQHSPKIYWVASTADSTRKHIVFSKCYALNRFLATLTLAMLKDSPKVVLVQGKIETVHEEDDRYICTLKNDGGSFKSDFQPLIRLGIDKMEGLSRNKEYLRLRRALAGVPLPFKPSRFPSK